METNGSRGRIHYIGYDNRFDEWRDLSELIFHLQKVIITLQMSQYMTHRLGFNPTQFTMICRAGKGSFSITIDMGFDYLLFKGGLQAVGVVKQNTHARNIRYKLRSWIHCWVKTGITGEQRLMVIMPLSSSAV